MTERPPALPPTVGLCSHEDNFLGLIIPAKTGVIWTNQTGGTACMQPRLEGFLIPLNHAWLPDPDPLLDFVWDLDPEAVGKFLTASPELNALFESVSKAETGVAICPFTPERLDHNGQLVTLREDRLQLMEAWVAVRVRSERPEGSLDVSGYDLEFFWDEALKDFAGQIGILTYPNSD